MKSLFKKHYERTKRGSAAVNHPARSAESKVGVATVERSRAEADGTPRNFKNVPESILSQPVRWSTLNESVTSQRGESTDIQKQVVDRGSYQQTQPNSSAADHLAVSTESHSSVRSNRKQSSSERNRARNSTGNVPEDNFSYPRRFGVLNKSTDSKKRHSSNILIEDNVQVIENKIFSQSQVQSDNQDLTRLRARKNDVELYRASASVDDIQHQRIPNAVATGPKKVRIWDGESKCALFLILILLAISSYHIVCIA
jgi:hypothetical protein